MRIGLLLASLLGVPLIFGTAFAAEAPAAQQLGPAGQVVKLATNGKGQVVQLRALDDAANPYAGQYADLDHWYFEHVGIEVSDEERRLAYTLQDEPWPAGYPTDWHATRLQVDAEGWLLPWTVALERATGVYPSGNTVREKVLRGYDDDRHIEELNSRYYIWTAGQLSAELREQRRQIEFEQRARNQPLIPAWLGQTLPYQAVFLPSGEILAYGALGLQVEPNPSRSWNDTPEHEAWYRYSPEGQLLETYTAVERHQWFSIFTDFDPHVAQFRQPGEHVSQYHIEGGYCAIVRNVVDPDTRVAEPVEVLATYDYLGRPVDPDAPLPDGTRYGALLHRSSLQRIYAAQVALGLVDPRDTSPYAGRADGPVVADPGIRPHQLMAYRMPRAAKLSGSHGGRDMEYLAVKPLDDPANPYLGQYKDWDQWLLEQVGQMDPEYQRRSQAEFERQRKVKALRKAGKPIPEELQKRIEVGMMLESDATWHRYQIEVDENGFIIPAVLAFQRLQEDLFAFDYREYDVYRDDERFHLDAGGVMPDEMLRAFEVARWSTVLDKYPRLSDWLLAQPTYRAAVMPNGEVITQGALGSWNADTSIPYQERYAARDRNYYRYSSSGQLLAVTDQHELAALYNPAFSVPLREHETYGYGQHPGAAGYRVVFAGVRGPAVAAYDFNGTPLPVNQPLQRPDGYARFLTWRELTHLGWAQQADATD